MNETPGNHPPANPLTFEGNVTGKTTLLGLARWSRDDQGRYRLRFIWKRVFITSCIMFLGGWLGLSTAAWAFVTYKRQVANVRFLDIALPSRWDEYQRKRGDAYIEQARTAMQLGRYREAFQMFRVGIAKSPANLHGRIELARIYQGIGRVDMGATVLEEGLDYAAGTPEYLGTYIQLLLATHEDDRLRELAAQRLPRTVPGSRAAQLLALGAATANFLRGDYGAAKDLIETHRLAQTGDGRLLLARIEWEHGHRDIALLRLRALIKDQPAAEEPYAVLFDYLRTLGRTSEASSVAVERAIAFPESAAASGALLNGYLEAGNAERLAREIDRMVAAIPKSPLAFFVLAEFAINSADVALADRLREIAETSDIQPGVATMVAIESRVMAGKYAEALSMMEVIATQKPDWLAGQAASFAGLRAVAYFGSGNSRQGELMLEQFLTQPTPRTESLLAISSQLDQAGARKASRRVLAHAASVDKRNQPALARLVEADLESGNLADLPANTERLLAMRNPALNLLKRAYRVLGRDSFLFSAERDRVLESLAAAIKRRENATEDS